MEFLVILTAFMAVFFLLEYIRRSLGELKGEYTNGDSH